MKVKKFKLPLLAEQTFRHLADHCKDSIPVLVALDTYMRSACMVDQAKELTDEEFAQLAMASLQDLEIRKQSRQDFMEGKVN